MPHIDFTAVDTPRFTRPELLRHHTIPRPLFGLTPRHILGQEWWDTTRRAAYEANNMRCWACGGPGPLEAHEAYDMDFIRARMTYIETVSLCSDCHAFIHIGRTVGRFARKEISPADAKRIVLNGHDLLKKAGLKCPWETRTITSKTLRWAGSTKWIDRVIRNTEKMPDLPEHHWLDWRLVLNDVMYPPRFKSLEEFRAQML